LYRAAYPAVRARYEEALAAVAERERRVRDELVAHLPEELRARLERLAFASRAAARSAEAVAAAEHAALAYVAALDEAIALAPEIEQRLVEVPDGAPTLEPTGAFAPSMLGKRVGGRDLRALEIVVATTVRRHDDRALVERCGGAAVRATFRAGGCPLACLAEVVGVRGVTPVTAITVATGVPLGAARLVVRPGRCDLGLDEPAFEGLFLVSVGSFAAQQALSRDVRAALLEIAHDDVPTLLVERGLATLRWSFDPTRASLDAAVRVLAPLRSIAVSVSLLRR
jgi:hypothetical protein